MASSALRARDPQVGVDVHRAARICAAGWGGQVLLSQTTRDLIDRHLPAGAGLRDRGAHRLKDLQRPEKIFQLVHADLPADFPPLKSLDTLPNNLSVQLTTFIGRDRELADVKRLVGTARLVTLTGAGGSGKTRLALQAAADSLDDFPDGVWLAELAPLADSGIVLQTVASALGVSERPGQPLLATLIDHLRSKQLMLILDNCEHLLAAAAALVDSLLRSCPHLRILATSREALAITGEAAFQVPSMAIPDLRQLPPLEALERYEAIRLFVDRAALVQQSFQLTASNAPAVARLCHRLDGIPLAIELAAARIRVLPAEEIAARLDDRFRLLTGGSRTALPRHQTLQAAVDWSYNLLSDKERVLLRRLAVFAGGFTLDAVEAVCPGDGLEAHEVLDLLTGLVEKSLVLVQPQDGQVRYPLLETLRQYAREKLQEVGEADTLHGRHRDFFLALVERSETDRGTVKDADWQERFDREHDDLRAALDWSLEAGEADAALRMGAVLWWFWEVRGYWQEGLTRLEAVLAADTGPATPNRVLALHGAGRLAWAQGDTARAIELLEDGLRLSRQLAFREGVMFTAFTLGIVARSADLRRAAALLEEAVALARARGELYFLGNRIAWLWPVVHRLGNYDRTVALARECSTTARSTPDMHPATVHFGRRAEAWMARQEGRYEPAAALYEEAVAVARKWGGSSGRPANLVWGLVELASLSQEQGNYERAIALYQESLAISREMGSREYIASSLAGLADVARDTGDFTRAAGLYEESLALGKDVGPVLVASALLGLGLVDRYRGDLARARAFLEESLRLFREIGDVVGAAEVTHTLGLVAHDCGDQERAAALMQEGLRLVKNGASRLTLVRILEGLASVAAMRGQLEHAVRMLGNAAAARDAMATPLPPSDRARHDSTLAVVRTALGEPAFALAWSEGRATPLERAMENVMDEEGGRAQ
ncbi:MAG: tetratricopeptide repeat protein [Armatimonadetes bacterium]|nr:tetratricopeptide repeat protein [Armatimonadota bacterium]